MLIDSAYFIMLTVFSIFWLVSATHYLFTPVSAGSRAVEKPMGAIYLAGLGGFLVLVLFCWQYKVVGLVLLLVPLIFAAVPSIKKIWIDLYAWLPTLQKTQGLTIHMSNDTGAIIQTELECWFAERDSSVFSLFKTFDYVLDPFEKSSHKMSRYQERLMSSKAAYIRITVFECLRDFGGDHQYLRKIQPCMYTSKVSTKEFVNGEYNLEVSAIHVSEDFISGIKLLKDNQMYFNGAFWNVEQSAIS
ncbi:hypothetical protein [Dyadobacter luticola]|uniref:Uncharacterized protein n=1 Tax=Dyadobacter luticola TaxID=1979387 RepID=A0A5R9L4N1_9BACT|nr:hypothetical protein [Dyadobacter luticola]TLV03309.1 hypothetical protein FEN17_06770 [Dyadobacter luticola]